MVDLERATEECARCLHAVASGQGNLTVADGMVHTLELTVNLAPRSTETVKALTLVSAYRAFKMRAATNPVAARHELELAVLTAGD